MQVNHEKITREFCEGKTLLFYPKNRDEVVAIQERLHEMGFQWPDKYPKDHVFDAPAFIKPCVESGMIALKNGIIIYNDDRSNQWNGLLCTADQLKDNFVSQELTDAVDQALAVANEVSAQNLASARKTTGIDLDKDSELYAAMFPKGQRKTLAAVWNVLAGEVRANPSLIVKNDNAAEGRLTITSSDGDSLRIDGKKAGPTNIYLSNSFLIVTRKENGVSIPDAADAIIEFLKRKKAPAAGRHPSSRA
jgi:hypothetical protein